MRLAFSAAAALLIAAAAVAAPVPLEITPAPRALVPEALLLEARSPLERYEAMLRARVEADGTDAQAWHALGTVLLHRGDADAARDAWTRARALDDAYPPADVMADVEEALRLHNAGDAEGARRQLAAAEAKHGANPYFLLMRGDQAMRQGAYPQAEAAYRAARDAAPGLFLTSLALGRFLEFSGDHAAARAFYEEATRAAPSRAAPWDFLGAHLFAQGRVAEARDAFRAAEDADPDQPLAEIRLGDLSAAAGDQIGARRWRRAALERATAGQDAIRLALADAQLRLGLLDEARETLDVVLASAETAPAQIARAWLDEQAGDLDAAAARYRRAVALDPGNVVASNNLAMTQIRLGRNAPEALEHARYAYGVVPNNAAVFGTHALALAHAGDPGAPAALARAIRITPDDPWLRYFYGKLGAEGDAEAARVNLEAALILDPAFPRRAEIEALLAP